VPIEPANPPPLPVEPPVPTLAPPEPAVVAPPDPPSVPEPDESDPDEPEVVLPVDVVPVALLCPVALGAEASSPLHATIAMQIRRRRGSRRKPKEVRGVFISSNLSPTVGRGKRRCDFFEWTRFGETVGVAIALHLLLVDRRSMTSRTI
jgi:hypothetical protein